MTNTYDGTSGAQTDDPFAGLPQATEVPAPHETPAPPVSAYAGAGNGGGETSMLAQLRERVQAKKAEEAQESEDEYLWFRTVPKLGLRMVCDPDVENNTFQSWLKRANADAKAKKARRRGGADGTDMNQLLLSGYALAEASVRIDFDRNHGTGREPDWAPLNGSDGEPLNLQSHELWRQYNVLTPLNLLQEWYGRKADAYIIDAGLEFLEETGYMGVDDPES